MSIEVGAKVSGKVSGITNFGAFVDLDDNQTGLVHISQISNNYVKDIHDVLSVGDTVTVKVTKVGDDGKIALSMKDAEERHHDDERGEHREHRHNNFHHEHHEHRIMILSVKVSMVTTVDSTQAITNRDTTKILMKC